MFTVSLTAAPAQAAEYGVVTANFVKVRQGPGADYPGISQLNRGHVVTRLRKQGEWTEVSFTNDKLPIGKRQRTGWMSSRYIKVDPVSNRPKRNKRSNAAELAELVQPTPQGEGIAHQVKTKSLKVRSGPSKKHIRLSAIPFAHPVMVFNTQNGWARITTIDPNNDCKVINGWVAAHFLKKDWATIKANNLAKKTRGQTPKSAIPKAAPPKITQPKLVKTEPKPQVVKPAPTALNPTTAKLTSPNPAAPTIKTPTSELPAQSVEAQASIQNKPSFKDRISLNEPRGQTPKSAPPKSQSPQSKSSPRGSDPATQPVVLSLEKEQLACQRTDAKEVQGCELTMRFSLRGEPEITRAKVRCEADLLVGMAAGDPVRYPLNQEQIYRVNRAATTYEMVTTLEASGGDYDIRTVDLLSHRCAVTAFGRSKK